MNEIKPYDWDAIMVTCVGLVADIPSKRPETITAGELIKQLRKFKPSQPVYYQKRSGKLIQIRYAEIPSDRLDGDPGWMIGKLKA